MIEWTDGNNTPVLGSEYAITVNPKALGLGESGWAFASVNSRLARISVGANRGNLICQWNPMCQPQCWLCCSTHEEILWLTDEVP